MNRKQLPIYIAVVVFALLCALISTKIITGKINPDLTEFRELKSIRSEFNTSGIRKTFKDIKDPIDVYESLQTIGN